MAIKASGYFLEDVTPTEGFGIIDLKTGSAIDPKQPKVSMEAGLHTLFGTYGIHTHPVYVAALVSAKEGLDVFRTIFPESHHLWVAYASPGQGIYEKVKATLEKNPGLNKEKLIVFLQNHGLFISAGSRDECMKLHNETVRRLEKFFGKIPPGDLANPPAGKYLTPDHAVYLNLEREKLSDKQILSIEEITQLAREVLELIRQKGWSPYWLSAEDVDFLLHMEDEKYRQKLWGKKK